MDVHEKLRVIQNWSIRFDMDRDSNSLWFATVFTMRTDTNYFTLSYPTEVEAIDEALSLTKFNILATVNEIEHEQ